MAESLTRGSRVIVSGRLKQRSFETKEGEKRTVIELEVDEIGPSLRYATAKVNRWPQLRRRSAAAAGGGGSGGSGGSAAAAAAAPARRRRPVGFRPARRCRPAATRDEPPF